VNRRAFITLLGGAAAAWPLAARAQQPGKVWRIGVLSIGSAATARHLVDAFFKGMADLGYHEGSNVMAKQAWRNSNNTHASTSVPKPI
jgi:putative tryptophan/tyrosine transport system substrate-binding protein